MTDEAVADVRPSMDEVVTGLSPKAAKIRALDRAGYSRSDIAGYLGIRYQHVYNLLKRSKTDQVTERVWTKIGPGGRVVIPAAHRRALGLGEGDEVQLRLEGDEVRVIGRDATIRQAQELVAPYLKDEASSVDAFIAERWRETAREGRGD